VYRVILRTIAGLAVALHGPEAASADTSRLYERCALLSLLNGTLVVSAAAQEPVRNRSGAVVGTSLDLVVNAMGRMETLTCRHTKRTDSIVIERGPDAVSKSGPPIVEKPAFTPLRGGGVPSSVAACLLALSDENATFKRVLWSTGVYSGDRRLGQTVMMAVAHEGRPSTAVCDYRVETDSALIRSIRPDRSVELITRPPELPDTGTCDPELVTDCCPDCDFRLCRGIVLPSNGGGLEEMRVCF
jgi:hypothetical protein